MDSKLGLPVKELRRCGVYLQQPYKREGGLWRVGGRPTVLYSITLDVHYQLPSCKE